MLLDERTDQFDSPGLGAVTLVVGVDGPAAVRCPKARARLFVAWLLEFWLATCSLSVRLVVSVVAP